MENKPHKLNIEIGFTMIITLIIPFVMNEAIVCLITGQKWARAPLFTGAGSILMIALCIISYFLILKHNLTVMKETPLYKIILFIAIWLLTIFLRIVYIDYDTNLIILLLILSYCLCVVSHYAIIRNFTVDYYF